MTCGFSLLQMHTFANEDDRFLSVLGESTHVTSNWKTIIVFLSSFCFGQLIGFIITRLMPSLTSLELVPKRDLRTFFYIQTLI